MRRAHARSLVALIGSALVFALVIALPLTLALLPAAALHGEMGAGAGTGDLTAAALTSLDQDLQTQRLLPPHTRADHPTFFLLASWFAAAGTPAERRETPGWREAAPSSGGTLGPTGAGHVLRC